MCLIQYCAKAVRRNLAEFAQNLPKLYIILNFWWHFYARIVPISLKFCANMRNFAWDFVPRTTKFYLKYCLGSEISWNISFVRVDVKLNVDEIRVVHTTLFKWLFTEIYKYTHLSKLHDFFRCKEKRFGFSNGHELRCLIPSISRQATFVVTAGRFSLLSSLYWQPWLTRRWLLFSSAWHLHVSASF